MTDRLRVRAYNVEFGDAILVSIPDQTDAGEPKTRHLLIDVGNKAGKRGANKVFAEVIDAIHAAIKPDPIDLYVMTHEHLDHVEGLYSYAKEKPLPFEIERVWMTASAAPDYADRFPDAVRMKREKRALYFALKNLAVARNLDEDAQIAALLENNDPDVTDTCVNFLRTLAPGKTHYIHRGMDVSNLHPFRTAKISIWAPEEDSTTYYARKKKPRFAALERIDEAAARRAKPTLPVPLPGVDATAFYNLVERRELSVLMGLFSIDKAANDTSVVFCLEWGGRKLLFVGDAEQKSWSMMASKGVFERVDFLKIGHHGSHNATPPDDLLDKFLPKKKTKKASALLSTCEGGYNHVPDGDTLARLAPRATVKSTEDVDLGRWVDLHFDPT